jgi:hypothetical protein
MAQVFQYTYIYIYICENVYYSRSKGQKKEGMKDGGDRKPEATGMTAGLNSVP